MGHLHVIKKNSMGCGLKAGCGREQAANVSGLTHCVARHAPGEVPSSFADPVTWEPEIRRTKVYNKSESLEALGPRAGGGRGAPDPSRPVYTRCAVRGTRRVPIHPPLPPNATIPSSHTHRALFLCG